MAYDLVIRGGHIVDGTGREAVAGDIGVENGLITAMGKVDGRGHREIDAFLAAQLSQQGLSPPTN